MIIVFVYVFSTGQIVLGDTGKNLLADEKVQKSFMGGL
jgi:ABC-type branched-subunit amino acid transport system ATPase component